MRVLMVNKFWYDRGGLERVVFGEVDALEAAGHEVAHFACAHPLNEPSPWSRYFAPYIELGPEGTATVPEKALAAARMFHNGAAVRRFERLLADYRPDVVHCHGVHRHLSPGVLAAARRRGLPLVLTMHDYNAVCPQDLLVRGGGAICRPQLCGRHNYLPCLAHACMRGSRALSVLASAELFWRRWVRRYERFITRIIAPSGFLADVVTARGWDRGRIVVVPNAAPVAPESPPGDYFFYAGRVAREKGAAKIVAAAEKAGVRLILAGDGPLRAELEARHGGGRIEFLGRIDAAEVGRYLVGALCAVVPSEWYENCSVSAVEALAAGRPLVVPDIGGFPEIARHEQEGLLVPVGELAGYVEALSRLDADRELASRLGRAARARALERFSPEVHLRALEEVYRQAREERG